MSGDTYGVIEAQRRYRDWMPHLTTDGQRVVYGAMLSYFGVDGICTPTVTQISALARFAPRSVRRILKQLEDAGALMRVGSRSVLSGEGVARGGHVVIWSIPLGPSEDLLGDSQEDRNQIPIGPKPAPSRTLRGHPLKVEKLKEGSYEPLDPEICPHRAVDEDGWCAGCSTQRPDR